MEIDLKGGIRGLPRISSYFLVEKADADLHCVDWNPHNVNFILTGSDDYTISMFDRRNLKSGGVGSPVHVFEGHDAVVLCVQWSPDKSFVFGSSAEDGILNLWDIEKIGKKQETSGSRYSSYPQGLLFKHAGHRDKVVDFHWNSCDLWTIVSVSDDEESTGGGGTLYLPYSTITHNLPCFTFFQLVIIINDAYSDIILCPRHLLLSV
ncbi:WD-40 repeat-containing protein MSI4-like [Impatiens glandulifera]|uniref:WD-40 repeat-containing protein MSI4-like n=1 Tax=Impatiens glandulifera TaxID=253017 RepID=UPI001FB06076|nr:WD-40 repeat-containing protein MSI4-like [Impatiens glandulifera]